MKCAIDEFKKYCKLVKEKKLQNKVAAKACNYTPEAFSRLRRKYEKEGDKMFVHGLKGKKGNHQFLTDKEKDYIVSEYLIENDEKCPINFNYWTDELNESRGIKVSYATVYDLLTSAGIESPEARKPGREPVKRIRFRRKNFGELLQWDATPYQWFLWAGDTNYYALHGVLDDSRSTFLALYMTENECRYGYLECRRQVLTKYGIELEDYSDKSPVFHNNAKERTNLTVEEQLAGTAKKPALWEALNEILKVELHLANSPQAKGKVERGWETAQGRFVNELKKRGIKTMQAANAYFESEGCDYYAAHFGKNLDNASVFRPLPKTLDLKNLLCVKEKRVVNKLGQISFKGLKLKINGIPKTGAIVDLCINEKGIWVNYKGKDYSVEIKSGIEDLSDAPQVLENIIYEYMYEDMHVHAA